VLFHSSVLSHALSCCFLSPDGPDHINVALNPLVPHHQAQRRRCQNLAFLPFHVQQWCQKNNVGVSRPTGSGTTDSAEIEHRISINIAFMVVSLQHLRPPGSDPPAQQAAALVFCSLAVTKKTTAISSLLLSLSQEPTDENERGEEGFCSETTSHNSQTRTEKRLLIGERNSEGFCVGDARPAIGSHTLGLSEISSLAQSRPHDPAPRPGAPQTRPPQSPNPYKHAIPVPALVG
jgi:hypothetical protein